MHNDVSGREFGHGKEECSHKILHEIKMERNVVQYVYNIKQAFSPRTKSVRITEHMLNNIRAEMSVSLLSIYNEKMNALFLFNIRSTIRQLAYEL